MSLYEALRPHRSTADELEALRVSLEAPRRDPLRGAGAPGRRRLRQAGSVAVTPVAGVVAGVDVGNHTTEIVLARVDAGDRRTTRPRAGPHPRDARVLADSLEGAAALLHKLEVDAGVVADELLLAALRPVDTATAPLPPPSSPRSPVLQPAQGLTPARRRAPGSGSVGTFRWPTSTGAVIDGSHSRFRRRDHRLRGGGQREISAAVERGWHVVGVIAAQDDAVLIRNRISIDVPVVDEVDVDGRRAGCAGRRRGRRRGPRLPRDGRPDRALRRTGTRTRTHSARRRVHPRTGGFTRDRRDPARPDRLIRPPSTTTTSTAPSTAQWCGTRLPRPTACCGARPPGQRGCRSPAVDSRQPSTESRSTTPSSPTSRRSTTEPGCGAVSPTPAAPWSRCWPPTTSPTRRPPWPS